MGKLWETKSREGEGGGGELAPKDVGERKELKDSEKGQTDLKEVGKESGEADGEGESGGGQEKPKGEQEGQNESKGRAAEGESGEEDEEDEEDGSRMDLLSDLREEQRARRKGGGRSVSALMGVRRRNKELDALVIKGKGGLMLEVRGFVVCLMLIASHVTPPHVLPGHAVAPRVTLPNIAAGVSHSMRELSVDYSVGRDHSQMTFVFLLLLPCHPSSWSFAPAP